MESFMDFITNVDFSGIATDTRVMFAAGALFLAAVIFRWKAVALLIFGAAGFVAVTHFSKLSAGHTEIGKNLYVFIGGTLVLGFVLIYFLFMRGD